MTGRWPRVFRRLRQALGRPPVARGTAMAAAAPPPTPYTVYVDDNFHYMDEGERRTLGSFPTYERAVAACQAIVDRCLEGDVRPGMTADVLYDRYKAFGEDPFIVGAAADPPFSAWSYAHARCQELCRIEPAP